MINKIEKFHLSLTSMQECHKLKREWAKNERMSFRVTALVAAKDNGQYFHY